jgi:hypothetical protein
MEAAPKPDGEPEVTQAKNYKSDKSKLPVVESPPLSPVGEATLTAAEPSIVTTPAPEPVAVAPAIDATVPPVAALTSAELPSKIWPRFTIRPRHKRYGVLAASVTFAAALGAVTGALWNGGAPAPAKPDVAAIEQSKAMQQSIAKLNKEIASLKTNLDQASKAARTQIAKISEKLEQQAAEITGSIATPQTIPAAQPPLPVPRPTQRFAAMEPPPPSRIPVVAGWTIHDTRNGYVFVESRGEIFQVQIGAPLPGLGPVQSVKRQDGRWMVVTPKGMIVSMRDRRYFEDF